MNVEAAPCRTVVEQLLGKYLLIAGEVDMFITYSQSLYKSGKISKTWIKKDLAEKLKWYGSNLDLSVPEHARLVDLIKSFNIKHRPFRNTLAHSALTLNVDNDKFEAMNADGSSDSISIQLLGQQVNELSQLNKDLNESIALSVSIYLKNNSIRQVQ